MDYNKPTSITFLLAYLQCMALNKRKKTYLYPYDDLDSMMVLDFF